jgi:hypothetical protein
MQVLQGVKTTAGPSTAAIAVRLRLPSLRMTGVWEAECKRLVDELEVFAGFEADGAAWSDADFGAGARVTADAGLSGFDSEDAEAAELDALAFAEAALHGLEDGVYCCFGLGAYEAGTVNYTLNKILFDQSLTSSHSARISMR